MNDIDIAVVDGSTGRNNLLQLVKGCPEDSSGVSHAMVPIVFTGETEAQDVKVICRAIFKRDLSTNKQGVASMVMQVKIPYVRVAPSSTNGSGSAVTRTATISKDFVSCHIVLALPKAMLADWRDSSRQRDAETQLNVVLQLLNAWALQYGTVTAQVAETGVAPGGTIRSVAFQRLNIEPANPSESPQRVTALVVEGEPGQRATTFMVPRTVALRDPLTDPLMSAFGGVCADTKPAAAIESTTI